MSAETPDKQTASLTADLVTLESRLAAARSTDQQKLRQRLRTLRKRQRAGLPIDRGLATLQRDLQSSIESKQPGASLAIHYDELLPITARVADIAAAIDQHQVVVVAGETGSGKTTQLPKICLQAGRGANGRIGITQPRRIAARSIARRLCEELSCELGSLVGYQVRFDEKLSEQSQVKLMTDGILLAETQRDRWLKQYDTIIIDEAHERSLNIDFLLGYLKQLLPRRPDLKLIITSATIDTERFAAHFADAPVIEVSGRGYPVEMRYRPLEDDVGIAADLTDAIVAAVEELSTADPLGDILVFLPGERDIRETQDALVKRQLRNTELLPLYSRLSTKAQGQIFHPGTRRRIILATNVAETSLTVPRIKFVIDSGLARISRYSHRSKVQRLPIEAISQASANQRSGRCGRLGPGVCVRLYSEDDFANRAEFTEPEIIRTNLASVILQMATLRLGQVDQFPFVDPPDIRLINDGYQLLAELQALDDNRKLTAIGREMARWPMDVRLARMMVAAREFKCLREVVVLCAGLAIADPRERPTDAQQKADQAHAHWQDDQSDFMSFLSIWQDYAEVRKQSTNRQLRQWCQQRFLNGLRMREWSDLQRQFTGQLKEASHQINAKPAAYEAIHRAVLAAFVGQIGLKLEREYQGARNRRLHIFPGSGLFKKQPRWLVSAFVVETTRIYARMNARIEPEWAEQAGQHLVKRRVFDPYWSKRAGKVLGYEQITLYGLSLVSKRRINFGSTDPVTAHQIFLLDGLARGQLNTKGRFLKHNLKLIADIAELEVRQRKHDLLVDDEDIAAWYGQLVPPSIHNAKTFERWRVNTEREHDKLLWLSRDELLRTDSGVEQALFPARLEIKGVSFELRYLFSPNHVNDGVTINVPLHLLNVVEPPVLEWLVPGLLREKTIALIKSLAKPLRRLFVPVPDCADRFLAQMISEQTQQTGSLHQRLAKFLSQQSGQQVSIEDFALDQLPQHLTFNVHLFEGRALLAGGRDLTAMQAEFGEQARDDFFDQAGQAFNRDGLNAWNFGDLPAEVELDQGTPAFPALVDQGECVGIRLFDTAEEARAFHRAGLARLLQLVLKDKFRYAARALKFDATTQLHYAVVGSWESLRDDALEAIALRLSGSVSQPIRDAEAFERQLLTARAELGPAVTRTADCLTQILATYYQLRLQLEQNDFEALYPWVYEDIQSQLGFLIYPGFVADVGLRRLAEYPRYFEGIALRLEALRHDPSRDHQRQGQVESFWQQYLSRVDEQPEMTTGLEPFRWLLEEYRVSLFAQKLKTAQAVSAKRLARMWQQLTR